MCNIELAMMQRQRGTHPMHPIIQIVVDVSHVAAAISSVATAGGPGFIMAPKPAIHRGHQL